MTSQFKEIQISRFPTQMIKEIRERIRLYSVAMLIYDDEDIDVIPCSGSLCRIGEEFGIITARHVWNDRDSGIKSHKKLKIVLGKGAYTLDSNWLTPVYPAIVGKESNCNVPDIAFLRIPSTLSSTFESYSKLFYPIDRTIEKYRDILFDHRGLWFTFGSPKDRMNTEKKSVASTTYVTDLSKQTENDEWDYVYLNVSAEEGEMPEDVRGMSGGGIWKAVFSMREDLQEFRLHAVLLSGVNFYQTLFGKKYQILGHGPKSIYKNLYEFVIPELKKSDT